MIEDWRFRESPPVHKGLRAYAGAALHFQTEFGEHVAFGSLCVASDTKQESLSMSQQRSLARLADWAVADIVHSARARRRRERRKMLELVSVAQNRCEKEADFESVVLGILSEAYPTTTIKLQISDERRVVLDEHTSISPSQLEHGLWEDGELFDDLIKNNNHEDLIASRIARAIVATCADGPSLAFLIVGTNDFRLVFDDIDSWFVQKCAEILSRGWQNRALRKALSVKENFLRGITHQLRTPIHGILGSVELLAEELNSRSLIDVTAACSSPVGPLANAEKFEPGAYINTIRTSARELMSTVNSMIKLNRWTEIAPPVRDSELHHVDRIEKALLNEILPTMPENIQARPSIIFRHQLPPNCDSLSIDLKLFTDIVLPLVVNAIQHTTAGIVAITISIPNDYQSLVVDIEDTGSGISPTDQDRIFEACEKVDANTMGAGLGLTLATRLATLVNGSISLIKSNIGKGTHFRATFNNPTCACSFNPPKPFKENFIHLPPTFFKVPQSSHAMSLSYHIGRSLIRQRYLESKSSDGALFVLDYTSDLSELDNRLSELGDRQVAICLVPESESVVEVVSEQVRRETNIVYIRGPFLSTTLTKALEQANTVCARFLRPEEEAQTTLPEGISNGTLTFPSVSTQAIQASANADSSGVSTPTEASTGSAQALRIRVPPPFVADTSSKPSTKPLALLVDDNAINLRLLEMYCNRRGIPYCTATDGEEAISLFSQHQSSPGYMESVPSSQSRKDGRIELVITDLQMPKCDGISATRQIRTLEQELGLDKSVVFIVTGQDSPSDRTDAEGAGADGFFVKPVGPKTLDRGIQQWFPHFQAK